MRAIGTVLRLISVSRTGGAIFLLRADEGQPPVKVKADFSVLRHAPSMGERLCVTGELVSGVHGDQIHPISVIPEHPIDSSVVKLITHHTDFTCISPRRINSIARKLDNQLVAVLNDGDVSSLLSVGVPSHTALQLLQAWDLYTGRVSACKFLIERGIRHELACLAYELWGQITIEVVSRNPYALLAVANWTEVDPAARAYFGISTSSTLRIRGCCESICNDGLARGTIAVSMSDFSDKLNERLGISTSVAGTLSTCSADRFVHLVDCDGQRYVRTFGIFAIEESIRRRLTKVALRFVADGVERDGKQPTCTSSDSSTFASMSAGALCTIDAPGALALSATHWIATKFPKALHVSPTGSMFAGLSKPRIDWYLLTEVIAEKLDLPDLAERTVVVHDASSMSILLLNKLLRYLQTARRIFFIGDTLLTTRYHPGHTFLSLSEAVGIHHLSRQDVETLDVKPMALARLPSALTEGPGYLKTSNSAVHRVTPGSPDRLEQAVLQAYRPILETAPDEGIIIGSSRDLTIRLNGLIHDELHDYQLAIGQSHPQIPLANKQSASIGDMVVFHGTDYVRGLYPGSRGEIIKIVNLDSKSALTGNMPVARVRFDTAGDIDISDRDAQAMSLAHAIQVHHSLLSRWRTVVVVVDKSSAATFPWLWAAIGRAIHNLIVIADDLTLAQSLERRGRSSIYLPNFDINRP